MTPPLLSGRPNGHYDDGAAFFATPTLSLSLSLSLSLILKVGRAVGRFVQMVPERGGEPLKQ